MRGREPGKRIHGGFSEAEVGLIRSSGEDDERGHGKFGKLRTNKFRRHRVSFPFIIEPLAEYEISRNMLISCLIVHPAVVVEYQVACL